MEKAMEDTKEITGLILNFALNYGSRDEIVSAVQHMMKDSGGRENWFGRNK